MINFSLEFDTKNFDLIIFTDGSGTVLENPCGYAALLYYPKMQKWEYSIGADNHGSNNFAELFAVIKALYSDIHFAKNILVVSDSEWTVKTGNGEYTITQGGPLEMFWAALNCFRKSFRAEVTFLHVKRNTNPYNTLCDEIAGKARKNFSEFLSQINLTSRINMLESNSNDN